MIRSDSAPFSAPPPPPPAIERGFSYARFCLAYLVVILIFAVRTNGAPREENINHDSCVCTCEKNDFCAHPVSPDSGKARLATVSLRCKYICKCIYFFVFIKKRVIILAISGNFWKFFELYLSKTREIERFNMSRDVDCSVEKKKKKKIVLLLSKFLSFSVHVLLAFDARSTKINIYEVEILAVKDMLKNSCSNNSR